MSLNGMGQLIPPLTPVPPRSHTALVDPRAVTAKCAYCGLYGALGRCQGCGAPNEPAPVRRLPRLEFDTVLR